jgi:hypothetical protein
MHIPRLHVREAGDPSRVRMAQPGQDRQTVAVYRPNLPRPSRATTFVGQGIKPNPELHLASRPATGQTPGIAIRSGSRQPLSAVNVQSPRGNPLPGFQNKPLPDSASRPLPGFQNKPLPDSASQPLPGFRNEPFPGSGNQLAQPAPPAQNHSVVIIRDRAHPTIRAESPPAAQAQPRPQYQRTVPQVAPKYSQQDQRTFSQPPAPVQSVPAAQSRSWAPAAQPREHQGGIAPVQRSAPPAQSQPAQAAPQAQPRQAPSSYSSTPSSSQGSSRGNNPRSNR